METDENYISSDNPFIHTYALVAYFEIFNSYPTTQELENFLFSDFTKIPKNKLVKFLEFALKHKSQDLFYDATETTYARYNTGIQRVNRKIYSELKDEVVPFQWQDQHGIAIANSFEEKQFLLNFDLLNDKSIKSNKFQYYKPRFRVVLSGVKRIIHWKLSRKIRKFLSPAIKTILLRFVRKILYKKIQLPRNPVLNFFGNSILMTEYAYLKENTLSRIKVLAQYGGTKVFLVMHDAIPFSNPEWVASPTIAGWTHLRKMAEYATHIFVPSNSEREIVQKLISSNVVEISTLYLSGELSISKELNQIKEASSARKKILILGSLDPRKNHVRTILACIELSKKISIELTIIAGGEWLSDNIRQAISTASNRNLKTRVLIGISDTELARELKSTQVLLFCSFAEGFGLPVAEAGFLGIPVVCSNQGTVAEIGRLFAESQFVNPYSVNSIAIGIERALTSKPSKTGSLKNRTWNDVSHDVLKVISNSNLKSKK